MKIKNIFLSASIPLHDRDPKYIKTADVAAIRDAVIALTTVVSPNHRIICGCNDPINSLIYYVTEKLDVKNEEHVKLYQSLWFENKSSENCFNNIVFTDKKDDIFSSIQLMRQKMISENDFSAAVFIGGMDGVEDEYKMFKEYHPDALLLPIASTGAASKIIYDSMPDGKEEMFKECHLDAMLLPIASTGVASKIIYDSFPDGKEERLKKDYSYKSLFQDLLIDKI